MESIPGHFPQVAFILRAKEAINIHVREAILFLFQLYFLVGNLVFYGIVGYNFSIGNSAMESYYFFVGSIFAFVNLVTCLICFLIVSIPFFIVYQSYLGQTNLFRDSVEMEEMTLNRVKVFFIFIFIIFIKIIFFKITFF